MPVTFGAPLALYLPLTGGTLTGELLFSSGSASAPSIGFSAETNTGFYRFGSGQTAYTVSGQARFNFASSVAIFQSTYALSWSSSSAVSSVDTGLSRISAGIIGVGTGAAGSIAGGLQAATLALGGATIGTDALSATGTATISGATTIGGSLVLSLATASIRMSSANGSNDFQINYNNSTNGVAYRVGRNGSNSDHSFSNSSNVMARIKFIATNGAAQFQISEGIATPAGGTAGLGLAFGSTSNFGVFFGSGAPTLAAAKGSLYLRSDGTGVADRMYVNTDGSTTWTAVATVA